MPLLKADSGNAVNDLARLAYNLTRGAAPMGDRLDELAETAELSAPAPAKKVVEVVARDLKGRAYDRQVELPGDTRAPAGGDSLSMLKGGWLADQQKKAEE
ncbi:MAG: hypothetical protein FD187_3225, partial [bacterium]